MLAGEMEHKDHKGNSGRLVSGSCQWMTAGRGIIHSETPIQKDGLLWGFQLWINLPAKDKMCEPRYQDIPPSKIPTVHIQCGGIKAKVRVIAGLFEGTSGPVTGIATSPLYLDIKLAVTPETQGSSTDVLRIPIPSTHACFCYVYQAQIDVIESSPSDTTTPKSKTVRSKEIALFNPQPGSESDSFVQLRPLLTSTEEGEARLLLVAAQPLNEPVARHGPFVMNTTEELEQAFYDFQTGDF